MNKLFVQLVFVCALQISTWFCSSANANLLEANWLPAENEDIRRPILINRPNWQVARVRRQASEYAQAARVSAASASSAAVATATTGNIDPGRTTTDKLENGTNERRPTNVNREEGEIGAQADSAESGWQREPIKPQQQQQQQQPDPPAAVGRRHRNHQQNGRRGGGQNEQDDDFGATGQSRRNKHISRPRDDETADEPGDLGYDDYDNNQFSYMFREATRPMRHFTNIMGNMFEQMQDLQHMPSVGSSAAFARTTNGDGYSRSSSVVQNNGRTRGIVSETRNGRTSTRRIGGGGGDDYDDEY